METMVEQAEIVAEMVRRTPSRRVTTVRRKASPRRPLITRTRRPSPPRRRRR